MLEPQRLALYKAGKTDEEIAEILGQKVKTVQAWRERYHLPTNAKREGFDKELAYRLWENGANDEEIAQAVGCHFQSILKWRQENDLGANGYIYSWQTKLSPDEFAKIPEKYRDPKLCIA